MGTWKVAEDMIGAPIPRKARSASVKKSQECWISGGGGGGRRDAAHGQASTYPASPPSSNPTQARKKKRISATINLHPKTSSKTSSIQDIEIEVAEVLFEMTRQCAPKQENENNASKESIGLSTEGKPRVSSPNGFTFASSISMPSNPNSNSDLLGTTDPKRPRMRFAEESPTYPPSSGAVPDAASPLSAKNVESPDLANVIRCSDLAVSQNCSFFATTAVAQADSVKPEDNPALHLKESEIWPDMKAKEEESSPQKGSVCANLSIDVDEGLPASKAAPFSESPKEEKFNIDLISSVGKSSMVVENTSDDVTDRKYVELETARNFEVSEGEGEKMNQSMIEPEVIPLVDMHGKELWTEDGDWKERAFEEGKHGRDKDVSFASKDVAEKQQCRAPRTESKTDKSGMMASFPSQMHFHGWSAGLPLHTLGYVGQVPPLPPVVPLNGNSNSSKIMQSFLTSQLRRKRCATHCYLSHTIHYHQQMTRLNPFWSSTAGAVPFYVSKQCNINSVPLSGSAGTGGSMQGSLQIRCLGSVQEKGGCVLPTKNIDNADRLFVDGPQRKPPILQQSSQSASNDMFAPAFVLPLNQAQASVAGAGPVNRSGVPKLVQATGNSAQSSAGSSSTAIVVSPTVGMGTSMGFSYGVFPPSDAQYHAFLQNNGYPLPIPAHINGASPYRGPSTAQSLPFFGYSIYSSQMLTPPQFQLSLPQQQAHTSHPGLHHPSTSSGSSSSKKNTQQSMMVPAVGFNTIATGSSHGFPTCMQQNLLYQARRLESETGGEDAPSTADSKVLQTQNNYAKKFAIAPQLQNFPLTSPLTACFSSDGGSNAEKQQQTQNQLIKVDLPASKAFAMSFASLGGTDAALVGVAPAGLDFSSVARNHALFQSLPTLLQGQMNKKSEDGKSGANLGKAGTVGMDDEKISVTKCLGNVQPNSLTFSTAESKPPSSSVLSSSILESSSQALNFILPNNGTHVSTQPVSSAPPSESAASASFPSNSHHVLLQKQHQQLQLQEERGKPASSHSITSMYNDHLPGSSTATKFPQDLTGFPPTLIQTSASTPTPHWKPSAKATVPLPTTPTPSASSAKNQIPLQQQVKSNQLPSHKTQISFGVNLAKASTVVTGSKNGASLSSTATIVAGSAMNSVSKSSVGSPLSSIVASSGAAASPVQSIEKQQIGKCLSSSSSTISSLPVMSSTTKLQSSQHLQQQQLTKQHFSQAPVFFAHPYVQNQTSHSDAAVVNSGYFQQQQQQRPPDQWQFQQKQQQNLSPGWTGMLSLGPSSSLSLAGGSSTAVNTSKPAGNRGK